MCRSWTKLWWFLKVPWSRQFTPSGGAAAAALLHGRGLLRRGAEAFLLVQTLMVIEIPPSCRTSGG